MVENSRGASTVTHFNGRDFGEMSAERGKKKTPMGGAV